MIVFGTQDAGPAQYLSKIINNIGQDYICFSSKISKISFLDNLIYSKTLNFDLLKPKEIKFIIVGSTHNKNSLDYELLKWGKTNKIITVLIIEHWTNIEQRVSFIEKFFFPDQIWVNDNYVKNCLINLNINENIIRIVGNPVLEKQINYNFSNPDQFKAILFISEEMNSSEINLKSKYGFDEYEVVRFILNNRKLETLLYIKLHPAENKNKYDAFSQFPNVKILRNIPDEKIMNDSFIVGMNSILLLELSLRGYFIYSYRPNQKELFIGSKLDLTYNLSKEEFKLSLKTRKFIEFKRSSLSFNGSMRNIKKIIGN